MENISETQWHMTGSWDCKTTNENINKDKPVDIEEEIKNNKLRGIDKILIFFVSDGCEYCSSIENSWNWSLNKNANIVVNINENHDMIKKYSLKSTPTIIVYENGIITKNIVGFKMCTEFLNR
jgi:thioredoxin-related protein